MTNVENNENKAIPIGKKHKKRKQNWGYVYLFAFVFIGALISLSYLVKTYSPNIDVTIGNNDSLTLSDSEMDITAKPIDERLKWIQMEDEMPTVSVKEKEPKIRKETNSQIEKNEKPIKKEEEKTIKQNKKDDEKPIVTKNPPLPSIMDLKPQVNDFRAATTAKPQVIPAPKPTITKVYLGYYSSIEEAMSVQNKISREEPAITPFIKATGSTYIIQLGSFSDKEKATALVGHLRIKGYSPKLKFEN